MKILVVEDNHDIAANIADYFEPLGHQLDFAIDGISGLSLGAENRFDIIVLDIMLPKLNGIEVCTRLRQEYKVHTPILMLTAKDQLEDKLKGFESGADDYLVKPFSVKELEARLLALVKRANPNNLQRLLFVGDLQYDLDTCEAKRQGKLLDLNPIQRKLLGLLMKKSPKVVSRDELEDLIWEDERPDKDLLRTHIYLLRAIIDKPFTIKLLHTVHGAGYKLCE